MKGFTYVELLVAIAVGVTVYLLFSRELFLLLQAHDAGRVRQDISQTADHMTTVFSQVGQSAKKLDVSSNNTILSVTGNPCQLFAYNAQTKSLGYAESSGANCTPPVSTTTTLNPSNVNVTQAQFLPLPQAADAKTVQLSITLSSALPYASSSSSFTTTITLWSK